jgi:hypothetical protein
VTGEPDTVRPSWYWWAAMLASSLATGLVALLVAIHVNAESDRKWCSIVSTMVSSYDQSPPSTAAGVQLAGDLRDLQRRLACPR